MRDMAYDPTAVYPEPERTSLAAILGFIFSLGGCCFGATALLGLPLSIMALIGIGRSNGRVGGRGLAIAGLILGLLNIAAWGSCLGGIGFSWRILESNTLDPTERFFIALQQDQFDGARANLASPAADATDEELIAFREAYRATLGDFTSRPRGFTNYVQAMSNMGPWQSVAPQFGGPTAPAIFTFASGDALVLMEMDQSSGSGLPITLTVFDADLNEYTLPARPALQTPAPTTDTPSEPPTPDADPTAEPDPDADPAP